jgi:hypothetical protein
MNFDSNARAPSVDWDVIQSAAAGVQDAWDEIVDAYAATVWAVVRRQQLTHQGAVNVSRLTWLRLADRLDEMSPEMMGSWLEQTAEQESIRVARLLMLEEQDEAQPA